MFLPTGSDTVQAKRIENYSQAPGQKKEKKNTKGPKKKVKEAARNRQTYT